MKTYTYFLQHSLSFLAILLTCLQLSFAQTLTVDGSQFPGNFSCNQSPVFEVTRLGSPSSLTRRYTYDLLRDGQVIESSGFLFTSLNAPFNFTFAYDEPIPGNYQARLNTWRAFFRFGNRTWWVREWTNNMSNTVATTGSNPVPNYSLAGTDVTSVAGGNYEVCRNTTSMTMSPTVTSCYQDYQVRFSAPNTNAFVTANFQGPVPATLNIISVMNSVGIGSWLTQNNYAFTLQLRALNGTAIGARSRTVTVVNCGVGGPPSPISALQGGSSEICQGSLNIRNVTNDLAANTYTWTSSNPSGLMVVPAGNSVTLVGTMPGNYTLTVTASNSFGSESASFFITVLGPNHPNCGGGFRIQGDEQQGDDTAIQSHRTFSFAPSQTAGETALLFEMKTAGKVDLKIYNTSGAIVKNLLGENREAGNHRITWNAGELPAGIYVGVLSTPQGFETHKLVVLK